MTISNPSPTRLRWWERLFASIAASPFGTWLIVEVATRLDPPLMRLTGGRVNSGRLVGIRVALLTSTGAKSGLPRTAPLLYFAHGDCVVLIGSNVGRKFHPGWVHNLRAHPRALLTIDGRARSYLASEASSPERERLWGIAEGIYAGFRVYEQRAAGRRIPVFLLRPDTK